MTVLLIGEYFSDNLGDPLLCRVVEKIISRDYPKAVIVPFDMSGKISYTEYHPLGNYSFTTKVFLKLSQIMPDIFSKSTLYRVYKTDELRHLRVWCLLNDLLKRYSFDLVVFAGGSIFMDYFSGILYMIVRRFLNTKAKIIFHACGMSYLNSTSISLLKRALMQKNIVSISLRDSFERFNKLFFTHAQVTQTYDTALFCSYQFSPSSSCMADIGIGLIANKAFYLQQKNLVSALLDSNYCWKVFTNGAPYDISFARNILQEAGIPSDELENYIVPRPTSCEELIKTITQFRRIISFRMHSQIVASSYGIPSFGFAWDSKVTEFYKKLGYPHNCSPLEVDFEKIIRTLDCDTVKLRANALEQAEESRLCLLNAIGRYSAS